MDGIGDLPGITARLDYLNDGTADSLGVDAIWLSPFYPSPLVDYGYDVADYCAVHPEYGTLADFDRLVAEAHRRGMWVLVDLAPNHTSDQHPWFIEWRASRDCPRRNWYVWAEPRPDGGPPNNRRPRPATGLDHLDRCTRRRPPRHRAAPRGGVVIEGGQRCRVSASCAISAHPATGPTPPGARGRPTTANPPRRELCTCGIDPSRG